MENNTKLCVIPSCDGGGHLKRGMCNKHYLRWRKYGDPHTVKQQQYSNPEEAFAARTEWQGDCLIWTGANDGNGYGVLRVNGERTRAHRFAWERAYGSIPEGMFVDHTCHKKPCVNVEHLRLATRPENGSNRAGPSAGNATGVRNVRWREQIQKYEVQIGKHGKKHYFGYFADLDDAAAAAALARRELFGAYEGKG